MISLLSDGEDEGVDLHSGEFCVDVSTFGDIVFENQGREACDTTFEKVCETKTEQVSQVESHICGVGLYSAIRPRPAVSVHGIVRNRCLLASSFTVGPIYK